MPIFMSRLLKTMFLACAGFALAGCQQPLAPALAQQQPAGINNFVLDAGATPRVDKSVQPAAASDAAAPSSAKPSDKPLIASAQTQPGSQVGQLADGLFLAFKAFTGH
jgi:hypothetical protein